MDSCNLLFAIDSELTQEDLESLKFLCLDLLPNKRLLATKSNLDLFDQLQRKGLIEEGKYDFLAELLYIIGQHSLLKDLGTSKSAVQEALKKKRTVSSYRHMLFQLYEDITSEDLRSIIFLLSIPKKYEENKTFLDILYYLEKNDLLSEDNLDALEIAVSRVSLELLKKINDYKQTRAIEIKARSQSLSSEYDDKMQFSIQAQGDPDDDRRRESIGEIVQHVSERNSEKDLMDENTEKRISDLSLNEESDQEVTQTHDVMELLNTYPMNRKHRGYCLIINNSEFMKNTRRSGTEKDAEYLTAVFTWLGLDVEIRTDLLTQEIHDCLKEFSERDHTERDCFVCCILTHGESKVVYGTDNEIIHIHKVTSYFSIENCSTLAGKPKLFFIQACQGKRLQGSHCIEADAVSAVEERKVTITVPTDADLLVGMSTVDGYYSFRDPRKGTWYIQALCENLTKMVPKGEDILSILTKVNKDVSEKEYSKDGGTNMKQMPQPAYTLRQKLVFPKPLAPFISPFQEKN